MTPEEQETEIARIEKQPAARMMDEAKEEDEGEG
jgi:hypothetical protein